MEPATITAILLGAAGLITAIITAASSASKSQLESLTAILKVIKGENERLQGEVQKLRAENKEMRKELVTLREENQNFRVRNRELRKRVKELETHFDLN